MMDVMEGKDAEDDEERSNRWQTAGIRIVILIWNWHPYLPIYKVHVIDFLLSSFVMLRSKSLKFKFSMRKKKASSLWWLGAVGVEFNLPFC